MTIPVPAIPPVQSVALKWLQEMIPDLQAGRSLLTPIESWTDDVFATVSVIPSENDPYVPVHDERVQIDVWGRPSPSQQYRGVPLNRCMSIVNYLEWRAIHSTPLRIDFSSSNYASVDLSYVDPEEKSGATAEKPLGNSTTGAVTVALGRARLTVCFVYKVLI